MFRQLFLQGWKRLDIEAIYRHDFVACTNACSPSTSAFVRHGHGHAGTPRVNLDAEIGALHPAKLLRSLATLATMEEGMAKE